jgi:hypothetical protein
MVISLFWYNLYSEPDTHHRTIEIRFQNTPYDAWPWHSLRRYIFDGSDVDGPDWADFSYRWTQQD